VFLGKIKEQEFVYWYVKNSIMSSDLKSSDNKPNKESDEKEKCRKKEEVTAGKKIALLEEELEKVKKKAEEYLNNWKRAQADFINYKRRQNELFDELANSAMRELILEILPIYDTFSVAVGHIPDNLKGSEWVGGIVQIKTQLESFLRKKGVEEIKSVGEKFNPEIHEAVEMVKSDKPEGEIIEEIQKGYKLDGKVIRVAKVKVARK